MPGHQVTVRVFRYKQGDCQPHYDRFVVDCDDQTTVLAALQDIRRVQDSSLMLRHSCGHASCGTCGLRINGQERLSCVTPVADVGTSSLTIEPLRNFPVIADLVVDTRGLMRSLADIDLPVLCSGANGLARFEECVECGLCVSTCPIAGREGGYAGPAALLAAWRVVEEPRGRDATAALAWANTDQGCWRCHLAYECSRVCPAKADPAGAILHLRRKALACADAGTLNVPGVTATSTAPPSASPPGPQTLRRLDTRPGPQTLRRLDPTPGAQALRWLDPRGRALSSLAFTLNRLTGLGLLAYLYLHLAVLSLLLHGPTTWDSLIAIARSPGLLTLDVVLAAAIVYHGANGLRLAWLGRPLRGWPTRRHCWSASYLWLAQVATGLALVALLAVHMLAQHFIASGGLRDFNDVLSYVANPAIAALELAFLVIATGHALLGARSIVLDLAPAERWRFRLNVLTSLLGLATIAYGTWLALSIRALAVLQP